MPERPTPAFAPRNLFNDHNFAGDAFLKGLGSAPLSSVKAVVTGFSAGLDNGKKISDLINANSEQAQRAREAELKKQELDTKLAEQKLKLETSKATVAVSTEAGETAKINSQNSFDTKKGSQNLEREIKRDQVYSDLNQIKDPESFIQYLENRSKLAIFEDDKGFADVVRSEAVLRLSDADPEQQLKLLRIAESYSPGSAKALAQFTSKETQEAMLGVKEKATLDATNALTKGREARGNKLSNSGGLSNNASEQLNAALSNVSQEDLKRSTLRMNEKGQPVVDIPELDEAGNPKTAPGSNRQRVRSIPITVDKKETGFAATAIQERIDAAKAGEVVPEESTRPNDSPLVTTNKKIDVIKQKYNLTTKQMELEVGALLNEKIRQIDALKLKRGETPQKLDKEQRERVKKVLFNAYINEKYAGRNPSSSIVNREPPQEVPQDTNNRPVGIGNSLNSQGNGQLLPAN